MGERKRERERERNNYILYNTSAPIGCASSKGFLITRLAKPGGSFRSFQITRLPWQLNWSSLSLRYRLTNGDFDDVHLQLIIEMGIGKVFNLVLTSLSFNHTPGSGTSRYTLTYFFRQLLPFRYSYNILLSHIRPSSSHRAFGPVRLREAAASSLLLLLLHNMILGTRASKNLQIDYFMTSETEFINARCCKNDANTDITVLYPESLKSDNSQFSVNFTINRNHLRHTLEKSLCSAELRLYHNYILYNTSAPIGCASSKGFLITRLAKPGGSFRSFQITRLPWQLNCFVPIDVFYEGAVCRLDTA
eukprot:sb/3467230/